MILAPREAAVYGSAQTPRSGASIPEAMSGENAYTRTFRRVIETLGSVREAAKALGSTVADLEAWAAGVTQPPPGIFLKAIDIVAEGRWGTRVPGKT